MKIPISILCYLLLGLNGLLGQNGQELIVKFSEIDSLQYIEFKKEYTNKLVVDSTKKTIPDSSFALVINDKNQQFDCHNDYNPCYYYKGFLPPINSFVITHCKMYICETFLIDQTSGEQQSLFSPYDNECEIPVLSKDLNKMLVFASNVFDVESFISVYQRTDKTEGFNFESYDSLTIENWDIHEVIWINDSSFALITFNEYGGQNGSETLNKKYMEGEIK